MSYPISTASLELPCPTVERRNVSADELVEHCQGRKIKRPTAVSTNEIDRVDLHR